MRQTAFPCTLMYMTPLTFSKSNQIESYRIESNNILKNANMDHLCAAAHLTVEKVNTPSLSLKLWQFCETNSSTFEMETQKDYLSVCVAYANLNFVDNDTYIYIYLSCELHFTCVIINRITLF